jgi:hypothetical protein
MAKMNWTKVRQQTQMSRPPMTLAREKQLLAQHESEIYVMPEMLTSEQIAFIVQENLVERYGLPEGSVGSMSRNDGDKLLAKYAAELRETAKKAMELRRHWDNSYNDGEQRRGEKGSVKNIPAKGDRQRVYQSQRASAKQINLMRKYKMTVPANCSKLQASEIIDAYAKANNWNSRPK